MTPRNYGQACSLAGALDRVGERWSLLIVRDVMNRRRRFDELQAGLGIARNVLSARLQRLVDEDILERRAYQSNPERYEYFLTEKGLDLIAIHPIQRDLEAVFAEIALNDASHEEAAHV